MHWSTGEVSRRLQSLPVGADMGVVIAISIFLLIMMRLMLAVSNRMTYIMKARIDRQLELRKNFKDSFRATNGYSWDMVLVFEVTTATTKLTELQETNSMKRILDALADGGVETKLFYNVQRKLVYCKLRCDYNRFKAEAERIAYKLKLDSLTVGNCLSLGKPDVWAPIKFPEPSPGSKGYAPTEFIYAPFSSDSKFQWLYETHGVGHTLFQGVDRLKLLFSILQAKKFNEGCNLDIKRLVYDRCLQDYFCLHDMVELTTIEEKILRACQMPWNLDVDLIRNYFGEKIGFYFLFLSHYATWTFGAAFLGLICWANQTVELGDVNSTISPAFAIAMAIWTQFFVETWKRKQSTKAMEWGMNGFEANAQPRAQFQGDMQPDPVRGKSYLYFPKSSSLCRQMVSYIFITVCVGAVIVAVGAIFYLEILLRDDDSVVYMNMNQSKNIVSGITVIQIQLLNAIYNFIAIKLTEYENHRTDIQYEDALISKTFVFQFINSFSALLYTAFVKPFIPEYDECLESCLSELSNMLFILLAGNLVTGNIMELGYPATMQFLRRRSDRKASDYNENQITEIEKSSYKDVYDVVLGPFADYAEVIMLYGYTTMFVVAFPLASFMAFIYCYVEIRVDAWKLCQLSRRTEPTSVEDIGAWGDIVVILSWIATITNAAIITYSGTFMEDYRWSMRNWAFFMIVGALSIFKYCIDLMIADVPKEVTVQLKRGRYILSKLFFDAEDDKNIELDDAEEALKIEYRVRVFDDDPF